MQIKVNNFEGPLDLLLQLIEKEEMDITEVSLLSVAEQYLEYIEKIEEKKPDELADFLLIAAKLLYIKSKVLLPGIEMDGEEEETDLAEQLRMYKKYVEASKVVESKFLSKDFAFSRPFYVDKTGIEFEIPKNLTAGKLKRILIGVINDLERIVKLPKKSLERVISIKEKIKHIQKILADNKFIKFNDLVSGIKDKTELIVSFLGMLELSKQREVRLEQREAFGDIEITKI